MFAAEPQAWDNRPNLLLRKKEWKVEATEIKNQGKTQTKIESNRSRWWKL
jgi:hypothetical protein